MNIKKYSGFTLVELIIVITILAILATIAFVSFQNYVRDSRDSNRLTTMKNIETGLELFGVKTGNYPTPDNSKSITGSSIEQGIISDTLTKVINLRTLPKDPYSSENYTYSRTTNGKYYQVAITKENSNTSFIPQSNAEYQRSIVIGNYTFDPSLPSIIVTPESVTSSGIFDQNVCFVVNGGWNNIKNCVEKKGNMVMKKLDPNLAGYRDMDIYYNQNYNGTNNTLFIKDLSGNQYDFIVKKSDTVFVTGNSTASGDIFSSGGMKYDTNTYRYYATTMTTSTGNILAVDKDLFLENVTASGGNIVPGMTLKAHIRQNIADNAGIRRIFSYNKSNDASIDSGDVLKNLDGNILRFLGSYVESALAMYNDGNTGSTSIYGTMGCGNNNNVIEWLDHCNYKITHFPNTYDGKILFYVIYNFRDKKVYVYQNAKLTSVADIGEDEIKRIQEGGYKKASFKVSSSTESFIGDIYDISLYSRALSEKEIVQQSSILGY